MYLTKLSSAQKELFLDLCISLSNADNDFAKEEKDTIDMLCDEMNISLKYKTNEDSATLMKKISDISTPKEKRMISIELLGLVIADKKVTSEEKEFMEKAFGIFGIDKNELTESIGLVNELYDLYGKFASFINK